MSERKSMRNSKKVLATIANELTEFSRDCKIMGWLYENFGQLCLMSENYEKYVLATTYTGDKVTMPEVHYFETKEKMYEKMKRLQRQKRSFAFLPLRD